MNSLDSLLTVDDVAHSITSEALKARGHCCRNYCLHCPYGTTLKKHGLKFWDYRRQWQPYLDRWIEANQVDPRSWKLDPEEIKFVSIKSVVFGAVRIEGIFIKQFCLDPSFQHQGIERPILESYYFS